MKNLLAEKKVSLPQVLLLAWMVFSVIFVVQSLWRAGVSASYNAGIAAAVNQTLAQSQQCEPFTVFNGQGRVQLLNVACLQQPGEEGADATASTDVQ